jgi:hypothetical protein
MRVLVTKIYNALRSPHGDAAAAALMEMLVSNQITATASDMHNDDHEIRLDNGYWQSLTAAEAENIFRTGCANIPEVLNSGQKVNFLMHIFLPEWAHDLVPVPGNKASAGPIAIANEASETGRKRGPKQILDWPVIWTGIALIIHRQKGCPDSQQKLMNDISQWCIDHFGDEAAPGNTALKDNLRNLYQLIHGESPAKVFPKGTRLPRKRTTQKRKKIK